MSQIEEKKQSRHIPCTAARARNSAKFAQWYPLAPPLVEAYTNWRAETKPLAQHNNYVGLSPHSICAEVVCVFSCFHGPRPRYNVSFSLLFLLFLLIISIFWFTQS